MITLMYWASPNLKHPSLMSVAPGAAVRGRRVADRIGCCSRPTWPASLSYNKTYGSLAGVVVFLIWLWITNIALLIGAEFNSELVRVRPPVAQEAPSPTAASDPQQG